MKDSMSNPLIEHKNNFMLITDIDGNIRFIDQYSQDELQLKEGDSIPVRLHPGDAALFLAMLTRLAGSNGNREACHLHFLQGSVFEDYFFSIAGRTRKDGETEFILNGQRLWGNEKNAPGGELIVMNSLDGIVLGHPDGRVLKANPAFCKMLGYTEAEIIALGRDKLLDPEDSRVHYAIRIREKTGYYKGEITFLHKDGTKVDTEITSRIFSDPTGQRFSSMIVRDQSLHKITQKALRESENLYKMFFTDNPMPMMVYDAATLKILEVNKKAVEYYGFPADVFTTMTALDIRPEADKKSFQNYMNSLDPQAPGRKSPSRHQKASGEIREVEVYSYPFNYHSRETRLILVNDITEQRAASEIIANNEKRFRAMISDSLDVMMLIDSAAAIRFVTPSAMSLFGYDEQALMGMSCFDFIHPDELHLAKRAFETDVLQTPELRSIEIRIRHANGHWLWCFVRAHNMLDNPHVGAIKLVISDVTHRKITEDALRESEERYKTFIRQTSEGTWRFEMLQPVFIGWPEMRIIEQGIASGYLAECNDAMARMYGFEKAEDVLGASIGDMVNLDQPENIEYFRNFIRAGFQLNSVESVETDRHGNRKYFLNSLVGIVENGYLKRIWGTQRDVTEQKKAEEALVMSERKFRGLMQSGGDVIAIINSEGVVLYSSPTALTVLGNDPEENIGKNVFEHIHPGDRKWTREMFDAMISEGRTKTTISPYRYPHATKGYRWLETVVTDLRSDPSIDGFVLNSRDITERIKLETALRQYTEQLETAQRIAKLAYLEYDFKENRYNGSQEAYQLAEITDPTTELTLEYIVSFIHPSQREEIYESISRVLREGSGIQNEYRIVLPSGKQKIIAAMGTITKGVNGEYEKFNLVLQDITDMRAALVALQSSENRFRNLFDNSADGILLTIPGGTVQNANDAVCQLLGYTREEILKKKRKDIFDFTDESFHDAIRSRDMNGRYKGELRLLHKKGHTIDAEITSVHFKDVEGRSFHSTIIRDITEKKKQQRLVIESKMELQKALLELNKLLWEKEETEKRLRISERNLRAIFSTTNESFVLLDADFRVVTFNSKAINYFQTYLKAEMKEGVSYALSLPPDRRSMFMERMNYVLGGRELVYEISYEQPEETWFNVYANPVYNKRGVVEEICLTIADITHQKMAEKRIRETAENLSSIMETISDGMIILDHDWLITYVNPAAERILGIPRADMIGKKQWDVFRSAIDTPFFHHYQRVMKEKVAVQFEELYEDMNTWFEVSAYPIGEGVTIYFRDVSERRQQQMILGLEKQVLEINAVEQVTLQTTIHYFVKGLEEILFGASCMVLGLDTSGRNTRLLSAPSFPESFRKGIAGLPVHKAQTSACLAMHQKKYAVSPDIGFDPVWKEHKQLALSHGYRACRSVPVISSQDQVLGCLDVYYKQPSTPAENELSLLERAANFLRIIIENKTADERLRLSSERFNYVLKATNEAIYDWDLNTDYIYWGEGFTTLFGYEITAEQQHISFWEKCIHPEDSEEVLTSLKRFLQFEETAHWEKEYRFLKADNQYAYVMEKGFVLKDSEGKPFRMVGSIQDLTLRKQLEKELLSQELGKQKLVAQAAIDAQEKERGQIGKELHDNINQILTTTKLYLELARSDEKNRMNLISRSAQNIVDTIQEIRQLSRSLVPPSIGDLGLVASITDLIENVRITNMINIEFYPINVEEEDIEDNLKLMLFRVVQEQINNVLKHAKAKNLIIELTFDDEYVELNISDDGVGFEMQKIKRGLGLSNITSRADLFNGRVQILTSPGKGCKLNVTVPREKK